MNNNIRKSYSLNTERNPSQEINDLHTFNNAKIKLEILRHEYQQLVNKYKTEKEKLNWTHNHIHNQKKWSKFTSSEDFIKKQREIDWIKIRYEEIKRKWDILAYQIKDYEEQQQNKTKAASIKEISEEKVKKMDEWLLSTNEEIAKLEVDILEGKLDKQKSITTKQVKKVWEKEKILHSSKWWKNMQKNLTVWDVEYKGKKKEIEKLENELNGLETKLALKIVWWGGLKSKIENKKRLIKWLKKDLIKIEKSKSKVYLSWQKEYEDFQVEQNKLLEEKANQVDLFLEFDQKSKTHRLFRNSRIKKEKNRTWQSSNNETIDKAKDFTRKQTAKDFKLLYKNNYKINDLHDNMTRKLSNKLPLDLISQKANIALSIVVKSDSWNEFMLEHKRTWWSEIEALEMLHKFLMMKILVEYVKNDRELQQLINKSDEDFSILWEVVKDFEKIVDRIESKKQKEVKNEKSYEWSLVNDYNKIIENKSYPASIENYLNKPVDRILINGEETSNIDEMKDRIKRMLKINNSTTKIQNSDNWVIQTYNNLLEKTQQHFLEESQFSVNKFSLFWMVAWTQEITSWKSWFSNFFNNKNLSFSLEEMGPTSSTISYHWEELEQAYSQNWITVQNKNNTLLNSWSLWFISIEEIRNRLLDTSFSFDKLLEVENPQSYMEDMYKETLQKFIKEKRPWIENAQEKMRRSIEVQTITWSMENIYNKSTKKYWTYWSINERKLYYKRLFTWNETWKINNQTLWVINSLLSSPLFEAFASQLWVPIWKFLSDCNLVWNNSHNNHDWTSKTRSILQKLVTNADWLTISNRFNELTNTVKETSWKDIKKLYSFWTDETWDWIIKIS